MVAHGLFAASGTGRRQYMALAEGCQQRWKSCAWRRRAERSVEEGRNRPRGLLATLTRAAANAVLRDYEMDDRLLAPADGRDLFSGEG
jgi:hypothetical protein